MDDPKKLLVSESSVAYAKDTMEKVRDVNPDGISKYGKGYADGIEYTLKVLGLDKEAKS